MRESRDRLGVADAGPTPRRILYVAGYGRSGSTLLDMMLDAHPGMVGVGEVTNLFQVWRTAGGCTCGAPIRECQFWRGVLDGFDESTIAEADATTRLVEKQHGRSVRHSQKPSDADRFYGSVWRTIMDRVSALSGAFCIVDSSKTARGVGGRPYALRAFAGASVQVVHLVRDPRAVAWSIQRGSNRRLAEGLPAKVTTPNLRAYVGWVMANRRERTLSAAFPSILVKYESLVTHTTSELARILKFAGLNAVATPAVDDISDHIGSGHGIAGNRIRRMQVAAIRPDDEWRERLSVWSRVLSMATWPMARELGYPLRMYDGNRKMSK